MYQFFVEPEQIHISDKTVIISGPDLNHMKNVPILPGYFCGLYGEMDLLKEYMYIPIILFIIRDQINGISNMEYQF